MAQSISARQVREMYGISFWGSPNPLLRRCLTVSSTIGVAVLALAYLTPKREVPISSVDQIPDRFAKLILEEPKAPPAPPELAPEPEIALETKIEPRPEPKPKPGPKVEESVPRRPKEKAVPESKGEEGRELAQKQVAQLEEVKQKLDDVLDGLGASLASNETTKEKPERRSRRRKTRSGRSASQMASIGSAGIPDLDVPASKSAISGAEIAIESIGDVTQREFDPETETGGAYTGSEYRSNASLLAVVRRYAAGIQFCYDNELKKKPGLGGKLVVSVTVAPSGRVTDAKIVRDTVRSSGLASCALAQIEAWKFLEISEGIVTFEAPFVFTPPE